MSLFARLHSSLRQHAKNDAFFIANRFYPYEAFAAEVSGIRLLLESPEFEKAGTVAIVTNDDIQTYAGILACWFEARTYVSLSPQAPDERRMEMIRLSGAEAILDSTGQLGTSIAGLNKTPSADTVVHFPEQLNAYILFTSGSTGRPKTVPVSEISLTAFEEAVSAMEMDLKASDRWLQMFDLSFDLSIFCFLIPLLRGACIYTVPPNALKYNHIFSLMDDHQLTVTLMVPSVLQYFQPYFDEIDHPLLRYSLFCGEALPQQLVERWSQSVPKAVIYNVYGPVESTIFCTAYRYPATGSSKSFNGILSIGKPLRGTVTEIIAGSGETAGPGDSGELWLSGLQTTTGYLGSPEKNAASFVTRQTAGGHQEFYKTGDLCFKDSEEDIFFLGRTDTQVKIQGFRVEPGEIEHFVRQFFPERNVVALSWTAAGGLSQIGIFIDGPETDLPGLMDFLRQKLPPYMIPGKIRFIPVLPLNSNGKTDRLFLQQQLSSL